MLQAQHLARTAVAADVRQGWVVRVDGDRVLLGGLVEHLVHVVVAEGAALAGRQPTLAVDVLGELESLPAVGGQAGGERVLLELARRGDEGADRVGVVVPAGAGTGGQPMSQASLPPGPSRRTQVRPSGSSGREAISSESAAVRRTKSSRSAWVGAWTGAETEGDTDTGTVLGVRVGRALADERRAGRDANSAGRTTHAARIADEVHMDPPPQAHTGVGHDPE